MSISQNSDASKDDTLEVIAPAAESVGSLFESTPTARHSIKSIETPYEEDKDDDENEEEDEEEEEDDEDSNDQETLNQSFSQTLSLQTTASITTTTNNNDNNNSSSSSNDSSDGEFNCPYPECPKTFATKQKLKSHKKCHRQERCHECPDCGNMFLRKQVSKAFQVNAVPLHSALTDTRSSKHCSACSFPSLSLSLSVMMCSFTRFH
jgi:5'-3' exonuclease